MLTFAFMHYPYLVCILFGMPSLHLFTFLMFFKSCYTSSSSSHLRIGGARPPQSVLWGGIRPPPCPPPAPPPLMQLTHSRISSLLISRRLTRPRVASRYSVRPEGSATARHGVRDFEIHWISRGFRISEWISGFQFGFLPTGFFLYVLGYFSYSSQLTAAKTFS